MNTTLKFDRVILIKELDEKIKKVGDVFEIASIFDNSFLLRDGKTKVAVGVISFEDFEKHFVKEDKFKGWTRWIPLTGFDGQTDAMYRTNRKKVQVKFLTDKVRAEASCNKLDEFNLFFGVQTAYLRCLNKALEKKKVEYEIALNNVNHDIAENTKILKQMINSIES